MLVGWMLVTGVVVVGAIAILIAILIWDVPVKPVSVPGSFGDEDAIVINRIRLGSLDPMTWYKITLVKMHGDDSSRGKVVTMFRTDERGEIVRFQQHGDSFPGA
jgi:hypothetical protein